MAIMAKEAAASVLRTGSNSWMGVIPDGDKVVAEDDVSKNDGSSAIAIVVSSIAMDLTT